MPTLSVHMAYNTVGKKSVNVLYSGNLIHAFHRIPSVHSTAKTVNKWAWHAVQFRRTIWSERSDWSRLKSKTRSESVERRKKRSNTSRDYYTAVW